MSENVGYATLSVIPSAKGFGKALSSQVDSQLSIAGTSGGKAFGGNLLSQVKKLAAPVGIALTATMGVNLFKGAIKSASDLNESGSKVGVVFGKAADQIMAASKTSATAMGLSQNAYLDANGTFGNLLVSLGIGPGKAADMSQAMVKLAGDMASFNNASPEETLLAIRSGLTGETEPLKRFGVNMNESTLKVQALRMGLIKSTKEGLDPQNKALAAQALILAQTQTAQGDFARTSEGLANQQRIAAAQLEDIKTKLGTAFLPIVIKVTSAFNKFATGFQNGTGSGGKFKQFLTDLYDNALKPLGSFFARNLNTLKEWATFLAIIFTGRKIATIVVGWTRGMTLFVKGIKDGTAALKVMYAWEGFVNAMNPFGWIILGVSALAAAFKFLNDEADKSKVKVDAVANNSAMALAGRSGYVASQSAYVNSTKPDSHFTTPLANFGRNSRGLPNKFIGPLAEKSDVTTPIIPKTRVVDSNKLLDTYNLAMAIEENKRNLRNFSRYFKNDFAKEIADSGIKAKDHIANLVGQVQTLVNGFSATISDAVKQGKFNLEASKIVNSLESKLFAFQAPLDAINSARSTLATKIADAQQGLDSAIQLRADAAKQIADLLSHPFGMPSELEKALTGANATADSIITGYNQMVAMVNDRFSKISGPGKDALIDFLKVQTTSLLDLVSQRATITANLELAQSALEKAIQVKADYADNLSAGLKQTGNDLSEFVQTVTLADGRITTLVASPEALISAFAARLNALKDFAKNLELLAARGLGQTLIDQIVAMGASSGGALAASLATASDAQLNTLKDTSGKISTVTDKLGASLSDQFYGESVARATALRNGWASQQAAIDLQMSATAASIAAKLAPLSNAMTVVGTDSAKALLDGLKSQDEVLLAHAKSIGAQMAEAITTALKSLNLVGGTNNFDSAAASTAAAAAKLAEEAAKTAAAAAAKKAQEEADAAAALAAANANRTGATANSATNSFTWKDFAFANTTSSADQAAAKAAADSAAQAAAAQLAALKDIAAKVEAQAKQVQTLTRASGIGLID